MSTALLDPERVATLPQRSPASASEPARSRRRTDGARLELVRRPTQKPASTLDVVLVAHESAEDLRRCLPAVLVAATAAGARVLLVDNASTDGSIDVGRGADEGRVERIAAGGNLGYAGAVNLAVRSSSADYVLVLNPDVAPLEPTAFLRLVDHLDANPAAALVAPRLLNADGSQQDSVRRFPNLAMLLARQTRLDRTAWGRRHAARYLAAPKAVAHGEHAQADWSIGAAMCIRRRDLDAVGGWDDGFFLYFEDVDLCVRLRQAGRQVHWLPSVTCFHDHHRASDRTNGSVANSDTRRHHVRSAARFFARHPGMALRSGRPLAERPVAGTLRRIGEVALTAAVLLVLAPLLALLALLVRRETPGPALVRERRIGQDGREFTLLKLRTVRVGDDAPDPRRGVSVDGGALVFKVWPDPRVTRLGARLQRWGLDELPQLVNVLRGEMALVGPRPPRPEEVERWPGWYRDRLVPRPGVTGAWQVSRLDHATYREMIEIDLAHEARRSLRSDLGILLRTPAAVVRRARAL